MIFNYLDYPDEKEFNEIVNNSPVLKKLHLDINPNIEYDSDVFNPLHEPEFKSWLRHTNYRLGKVYMTYIFLMHYLNKGIPDDVYFISPGKNNKTIEFFPNFEEKHFYFKYLFCYYVDIFYYGVFSVWDSIYHLINVYYQMDFKPSRNFKKCVRCKLKAKNKTLYNLIENKEKDNVFEKARELRNDLIHNFPPHRPDLRISKEHKEEKKETTIYLGIRKYTKSKEFRDNINQFLELLSTTLEEIKINLER